MVEIYDVRPAARQEIESLGAKMIDTGVSAAGEGGYARELTAEEKQQQANVLARHIAAANAVITTAAIPGRAAPKIVTTAMVEGHEAGRGNRRSGRRRWRLSGYRAFASGSS